MVLPTPLHGSYTVYIRGTYVNIHSCASIVHSFAGSVRGIQDRARMYVACVTEICQLEIALNLKVLCTVPTCIRGSKRGLADTYRC